jgi:hypothetical protein
VIAYQQALKESHNKKNQRILQNLTQIWILRNLLNWYCTFNVTHTNHGIANAFNGLIISNKIHVTTFDVGDA